MLDDLGRLQGNISAIGQTFDALKSLQFFDATGVNGMSGGIDSGDARTGLCNSAKVPFCTTLNFGPKSQILTSTSLLDVVDSCIARCYQNLGNCLVMVHPAPSKSIISFVLNCSWPLVG